MTDHAHSDDLRLQPPGHLSVTCEVDAETSITPMASVDRSGGQLTVGSRSAHVALQVWSVADAARLAEAANALLTLMTSYAEARQGRTRETARAMSLVRPAPEQQVASLAVATEVTS